MNPEFGSNLSKYIFEAEIDGIQSVIESVIRKDVQTWMPYLSIKSVSIDIGNEYRDIYTVQVKIMFTVDSIGVSETQAVDITLTKPIL